MPHRLRSSSFPAGLPDLGKTDSTKCALGNVLSRRAATLAELAASHNVLGFEENPATSFLFDLHGRPRRAKSDVHHTHMFEQCMFGVKYRKRTRIDSWLFSMPALKTTCTGRLCSHTGEKHQVLSGFDGSGFCTYAAATYPRRMCEHIAARLDQALHLQKAGAIWSRFKGDG